MPLRAGDFKSPEYTYFSTLAVCYLLHGPAARNRTWIDCLEGNCIIHYTTASDWWAGWDSNPRSMLYENTALGH